MHGTVCELVQCQWRQVFKIYIYHNSFIISKDLFLSRGDHKHNRSRIQPYGGARIRSIDFAIWMHKFGGEISVCLRRRSNYGVHTHWTINWTETKTAHSQTNEKTNLLGIVSLLVNQTKSSWDSYSPNCGAYLAMKVWQITLCYGYQRRLSLLMLYRVCTQHIFSLHEAQTGHDWRKLQRKMTYNESECANANQFDNDFLRCFFVFGFFLLCYFESLAMLACSPRSLQHLKRTFHNREWQTDSGIYHQIRIIGKTMVITLNDGAMPTASHIS